MSSSHYLITNPQTRMLAYIDEGRKSIKAMYGIEFEEDVWPLPPNRASSRRYKRLNFAPFHGEFKSLLKAIVATECVLKDGRGRLATNCATSMAIHLAPHIAHLTRMSDISLDHFHLTIRSIRDHLPEYSQNYKYNTANTLLRFAQELDTNRLTGSMIQFQNPFPNDVDQGRCDDEAREKKRSKLPEDGALTALGEIYRDIMNGAGSSMDRLLVCATVLLCCTGFRVNEMLSLPLNCWNEGEYRDEEGRILPACSIGYAPEKGGTDNAMTRWVAPALKDLAKEAMDEIIRITEPFRENARAQFHGGVNLPGLEEGRLYKGFEAAGIMGYTWGGLRHFLKKDKYAELLGKKNPSLSHFNFTAQDIRDLVSARSYKGPVQVYPWRLELHESLFVVSHVFSRDGVGIAGTADRVRDKMVFSFLNGRPARLGKWMPSSFERFGKVNPETGKPWRITTHQFRHLLGTLFEMGGFTAEDIASYFGRNSPRANSSYNQMTGQQRAALASERYTNGKFTGEIQKILDGIKDPIRRDLAKTALFGNIQESPLGLCFHHDGSSVPTTPDRCAVCPGLAILKGSQEHIEETKRQLDRAEKTLSTMQNGLAKGFIDDGPWVPLSEERRERLRMFLSIHLDNTIADGTIIHPGNPKRKVEQCLPTNL